MTPTERLLDLADTGLLHASRGRDLGRRRGGGGGGAHAGSPPLLTAAGDAGDMRLYSV